MEYVHKIMITVPSTKTLDTMYLGTVDPSAFV